MFGRPLISTEVGSGTSHVNQHDVTGLVVAPGSARSLRRALDALYENPEKAERMGGQARLRYENGSTAFQEKFQGFLYDVEISWKKPVHCFVTGGFE